MVATQPLAKRTRALAMSSCALATGAPTASTLSIGLSTSDSTRSRSWIIRSRITDTSVPRGLNGAMRTQSIYSGRLHAGADGLVLGRVAQQMADLQHPAACRRPGAASASASASVAAIGFSTSTCSPACNASAARAKCVSAGVAMTTASQAASRRGQSSGGAPASLPPRRRGPGRGRAPRRAYAPAARRRASAHETGRNVRRRQPRSAALPRATLRWPSGRDGSSDRGVSAMPRAIGEGRGLCVLEAAIGGGEAPWTPLLRGPVCPRPRIAAIQRACLHPSPGAAAPP